MIMLNLGGRHPPDLCPCRKKHHPAPKPAAPDAPPNSGKQAKRLREAIEERNDARDAEDENAVLIAERKIETSAPGLEVYRTAYEKYLEAMRDWTPANCGDCGKSLLIPNLQPGCNACLSQDAVDILRQYEEPND